MAWEYLRQWGSWRHTDGDCCLVSDQQFTSQDMRCPICGGAGPMSETVWINAPGRPFELATEVEAAAYTTAAAQPNSTVTAPTAWVATDWTHIDAALTISFDYVSVPSRRESSAGRAAAARLRAKREPEPDPEPVPLGARRYDFED